MSMTAEKKGTFGARIKELREEREMRQEDLAQASGVPLSVLARLEQNKTHDPRYSTILAIAKALGVTISELTGE